MSADALVLQTLLSTCRQIRRQSPQPEVAKAALDRELAFAEQLRALESADAKSEARDEESAIAA